MQLNSAVASTIIASMFSMSAFCAEVEVSDDRKRHAAKKTSSVQLEPVVDIHNSPAVLAHPTKSASSAESLAELEMLRKQGEARDRRICGWHKSQGKACPERFPGD